MKSLGRGYLKKPPSEENGCHKSGVEQCVARVNSEEIGCVYFMLLSNVCHTWLEPEGLGVKFLLAICAVVS